MSQQIPTAWVNQYKANVTFLYQQSGSKLKGKVRERQVTGSVDFWDLIGPTSAVKKTVRHSDTPQVDTPHLRRMAVTTDYEWADLIDKQDMYKILIDPQSAYAVNAAKAMQRAYDDEVISAFGATASTGHDGTTPITFAADYPGGSRGAGNGDEDFTGAANTVANLATLKGDLDNNDVDDDNRYIIASPSFYTQLLKQSTIPNISSSDYNTVKALVNGEVNTFMGFTFIRSTRLPLVTAGGTNRYGYAWQGDAMAISTGMDLITRVGERADKSYATQVYCAESLGAVRVQGTGVVRFKIDESK